MKTIEQNFPVGLSIMLHKVVPNFECVDKTPKCDHLIEWNLLSSSLSFYYVVQGGRF